MFHYLLGLLVLIGNGWVYAVNSLLVDNSLIRVDNLYFTFLFVLRAVAKAEKLLTRYHYSTGNNEGIFA